jgi:hypothetical protein
MAIDSSTIGFVVERVLAFSLIGSRKLEIVLDDPNPRTVAQAVDELKASFAWLNSNHKDAYNIVDCGFDFASLQVTGEAILSNTLSSGPPFTGRMTQLTTNASLNVPTIKTLSLAVRHLFP